MSAVEKMTTSVAIVFDGVEQPPTARTVNCSSAYHGGSFGPVSDPALSCVVPASSGNVPPNVTAQCWGTVERAPCAGVFSVAQEASLGGAPTGFAFSGCGAGLSCTASAPCDGDTCRGLDACAPTITPCNASGATCIGNALNICIGEADWFFEDPFVIDCDATFTGECRTEAGVTGCYSSSDSLCSLSDSFLLCDPGLSCTDVFGNGATGQCQ